eukprot:4267817-Pleurochrysis_carterae.AAC.1
MLTNAQQPPASSEMLPLSFRCVRKAVLCAYRATTPFALRRRRTRVTDASQTTSILHAPPHRDAPEQAEQRADDGARGHDDRARGEVGERRVEKAVEKRVQQRRQHVCARRRAAASGCVGAWVAEWVRGCVSE